MTFVAAVAQGLLMKPPDQSLPFKTWKLTDHWAGILEIQATLNLLCETISALKKKKKNLTSNNLQMYTPHLGLTLNNFLVYQYFTSPERYLRFTCECNHGDSQGLLSHKIAGFQMYSFTEESQWTRLPQNNGCSLEDEENNNIFCFENIYAEGLSLSTEETVQIISVIYQII